MPGPSHERTSCPGRIPENGSPQNVAGKRWSVDVDAGRRVHMYCEAWFQRAKLHTVSSRSPPRPPGLGSSNFSQKAGSSRPQLPGSSFDGIGAGPGLFFFEPSDESSTEPQPPSEMTITG